MGGGCSFPKKRLVSDRFHFSGRSKLDPFSRTFHLVPQAVELLGSLVILLARLVHEQGSTIAGGDPQETSEINDSTFATLNHRNTLASPLAEILVFAFIGGLES